MAYRILQGVFRSWNLAGILLLGATLSVPAAADESEALDIGVADETVTIRAGDRDLLVYQRVPNPYKVYVRAWSTPQARQVLRDSPHDHVHHHALMYAIGADGVDFWGESPQDRPGKQVPVGEPEVAVGKVAGKPTATIRQQIQWQDAGGQTVLEESRLLTLHHQALLGGSLLTWDSRFRVPDGKARVELWGRHYFGLGLRMVTSMDQGGEFRHAGDVPGETVRGTERLTSGDWCAYSAALDGRPVTVAMFDHPGNGRPATWFTMTAPFAYLSATLNLDKQPLTLSADTPLRLRYGIALWDGNPAAGEVGAACESWRKSAQDPS